jgi:hypothetical protein
MESDMSRWVAAIAVLGMVVVPTAVYAQDGNDGQTSRDLSETRLKLVGSRVSALQAKDANGEALAFSQEPAMRYNDTPRGVVDASVWILGDGGRPPAVLVLEYYDNNTVMYELTGAAHPPKAVQGQGWAWEPDDAPFEWVRIPVDAPPAATARLRNSQLKLLIRDMAASEEFNDQTYALRILPRPIHEYEDASNGVLSGAVFVVANGTNAEILLFVEAREEAGDQPAQWVAGFSRLATASLNVTYREQDFWSSASEPEFASNRRPPSAAAYFSHGESQTAEEREAFRRR